VRKLPALALAGVAAALAGTAVAAAPKTHAMNVALPDGSTARVEYVGEMAPKVTVTPRSMAAMRDPWAMAFPPFAGFDRMFEQVQRQSQEMVRQAQQMSRQPAGAAPYIASFGNVPAGGTSTTVVSVSNGASTCTRTTEVVSQGAGKPPKVISNVSGQCSGGSQPSAAGNHPA
jgi:hypothetical protein